VSSGCWGCADSERDQNEVPGAAWQDVHLESDEEGGQQEDRRKRLLAGSSGHARQCSTEPKENIKMRPLTVLRDEDVQVRLQFYTVLPLHAIG
jgi:hypothetical protein